MSNQRVESSAEFAITQSVTRNFGSEGEWRHLIGRHSLGPWRRTRLPGPAVLQCCSIDELARYIPDHCYFHHRRQQFWLTKRILIAWEAHSDGISSAAAPERPGGSFEQNPDGQFFSMRRPDEHLVSLQC